MGQNLRNVRLCVLMFGHPVSLHYLQLSDVTNYQPWERAIWRRPATSAYCSFWGTIRVTLFRVFLFILPRGAKSQAQLRMTTSRVPSVCELTKLHGHTSPLFSSRLNCPKSPKRTFCNDHLYQAAIVLKVIAGSTLIRFIFADFRHSKAPIS